MLQKRGRSSSRIGLQGADPWCTGCTLLDNDGAGLLARNRARSRISGCLVRDDREGAAGPALRVEGGTDNQVTDNQTIRCTMGDQIRSFLNLPGHLYFPAALDYHYA